MSREQKGKREVSDVVDFAAVRNKKLDEKRQNTQRILFRQMLGIYGVIDGHQMAIDIVDLSPEGLAFQVPYERVKKLNLDPKELNLRLYFSQDTYLPLKVVVQNRRELISEDGRVVRFGCRMDPTSPEHRAYVAFTEFVRCYSEIARKDTGSTSIFYI